jgi:hypothetical protein
LGDAGFVGCGKEFPELAGVFAGGGGGLMHGAVGWGKRAIYTSSRDIKNDIK